MELASIEQDGKRYALTKATYTSSDIVTYGLKCNGMLTERCRNLSASSLEKLHTQAKKIGIEAIAQQLITLSTGPAPAATTQPKSNTEGATANTETTQPTESSQIPSSTVATATTNTADANWSRASKWLAETACKRNSERKRRGALAAGIKGVPFESKKELSTVGKAIAIGINKQQTKVDSTSHSKMRAAMAAAIRGG